MSAPTGFTITNNGNNLIMNWIPNGNADDTVIVVGTIENPTSITDGTIIYNGSGNLYLS